MAKNEASDTIEAVSALLAVEYDINGQVSRLAGENENYLVETDQGRRFVLKLADDDLTTDLIELEHAAVESFQASSPGIELPRIILTVRGRPEARLTIPGGRLVRGRLLQFVSGQAWCEDVPAGPDRLRALGRLIAEMNLALTGIDNPAAQRTHQWDLTRADEFRSRLIAETDPGRRRILEWFHHLFSAWVKPALKDLPRALIHGDVNDDNVLVADGKISGLLDFGDCLDNPAICDLAIALAYHLLDEEDPLEAGAAIVAAYHEVRPLTVPELTVLFPLICARLVVSVTISAERRLVDPDRSAWFVSEKRAWDLLQRFAGLDPAEAGNVLSARTGIKPFEYGETSIEKHLEKRRRVIAPSLKASYRNPLRLVRGAGQYLYDDHGRPFLDLYNNVCHVGHCHPMVVEAGAAQMARLNTNTRYIFDELAEYAERLTAKLPPELEVCYFVNSGSEANELALRLARAYTGQKDMIVVDNAYHGNTNTLIDISPYKFMGKGGKGRPEPWVHVTPVADGYRGRYKGQGTDAGRAYGDELGRIIDGLDRPIAGFITESLLSCGGQVIPPQDYFKTAFNHVRRAGGVCIVDEVQVGFGRVGTGFWAFELQDVVPDIVVMGKPIGNGHPLSAVVARRDIAESFANGMEFFSTFGGATASCAIGLAVLDVIEREGLQEHAREVGGRMLDGLRDVMTRRRIIGDVRGVGLFVGIELVRDHETLEPATGEAGEMVERLRNRGILLGTDGPFDNVIKIKPPMVMSAADSDMFVRIFDEELADLESGLKF